MLRIGVTAPIPQLDPRRVNPVDMVMAGTQQRLHSPYQPLTSVHLEFLAVVGNPDTQPAVTPHIQGFLSNLPQKPEACSVSSSTQSSQRAAVSDAVTQLPGGGRAQGRGPVS